MKKILPVFTSLAMFFVLIGLGLGIHQGDQKPKNPQSANDLFSIEDALALEILNFSSESGRTVNGENVAYAVIDKYRPMAKTGNRSRFVPPGSHVFAKSLRSQKEIQITQGDEYSWTPSWAPDGRKLAFYAWHNNRIAIGIWDIETHQTVFYELENLNGKSSLDWSPQSDTVYYFPSAFGGVGHIWPYEESEKIIMRASWEKDPYEERSEAVRQTQLWALDLKNKNTVPLIPEETSFYSHALSPDGKKMAVAELTRHKVLAHLVPSYMKLDIYPSGGGNAKTVFSDKVMTTPYSWSPDSASIAYVDQGKLWIYDLGNDEVKQLSPDDLTVTGSPLWHPKGKHILCSTGKEDFIFNLVSGQAKRLNADIPYTTQQRLWDRAGNDLFLKVVDDRTGDQGIYRVDWKRGITRRMIWGDWMISHVVGSDNRLFFSIQNATTPENIWTLNVKTGEKNKLTEVNEHTGRFRFGRSELVHWTSLAGDALKGVLIFPSDYEKGRTYPVVFRVYETFSHNLHSFLLHHYNSQILTNHGYAVFMPDVKFTTGETARSFKESIVPAMDKLIEIGIANGNFGITGVSFGGYATNSIITQTQRFKAAISFVGISDWVSRKGMPGFFWRMADNIGQARLGGDLREIPDIYMKNSPVFHLDKVTTPLMIVHGTDDKTVYFSQAEEMYYGLRDLNKTAILIGYPGETHLGGDAEVWVIKDFWSRMMSWFDRYLK